MNYFANVPDTEQICKNLTLLQRNQCQYKGFESVYGDKKTNNSGWIQGKDEVTLASNHLLHAAFSEPLLGFYGHPSARQPAVRVQTPNIPNSTFKTHTHVHTHKALWSQVRVQ